MEFNAPDYKTPQIEDWFSVLKKKFNPKFFLIVPFFLVPFLFYASILVSVLLICLTIFVSYMGHKTKLKKFGIELVTLTTVVIGANFGIVPGIITGIFLIILHDFITHKTSPFWVVVIPSFGIVGALAGIYSQTNIFVLGTSLTILSHALFMIFKTITTHFPVRYIPYFAANIFFNVCLFYSVAPFFMNAISQTL